MFHYLGSYKIQTVAVTENPRNNCLLLDVSYSERSLGYTGIFIVLIPYPNILKRYYYFAVINSNSSTHQKFIGPILAGNYQLLVYEFSNTGFIVPELLLVINSSTFAG